METLPALLLGLVQGAAEFLPISSSAHLALAQRFLGLEEAALSYDIMLHFATMLATLTFFAGDILRLLKGWILGFFSSSGRESEGWPFGWAVLAGTVLTGAVALPLKPLVEQAMAKPWAIGTGLLITACLLKYGSSLHADSGDSSVTPARGLIIGLVQGIAVMPGISRSGSTIVAGMKTGLSASSAFRFSFLLSVPAIFGATLLEVRKLVKMADWSATLPPGWVGGMAVAFVSGLLVLRVFRGLVVRGRLQPFAYYCGALGLLSLVLSFSG
ncbi:MAG: undecaprenyl-diphosphate phosphatase [Aminivibrio sp.]|jgi:undecaprenyl-diphosphatase